jgi:hypothetical protein
MNKVCLEIRHKEHGKDNYMKYIDMLEKYIILIVKIERFYWTKSHYIFVFAQ